MSKNRNRNLLIASAAFAVASTLFDPTAFAAKVAPPVAQTAPKGWDVAETSVEPVEPLPVAVEAAPVAATVTVEDVKATPLPSVESDAFKARMVAINANPKSATKDDLIEFAGTYGVLVKKSWNKSQILAALNACTSPQGEAA